MGNCLKTQLKESVNNPDLKKLGEYVIELLGTNWIPFTGESSITATNNTQNFSTPANTNKAEGTSAGFIGASGDEVSIKSKYDLLTIGQGMLSYKMQISDLEGMTKMTKCFGADFYGNFVDMVALPQLQQIQIVGRHCTGSLANVASKLPALTLLYTSNSNLSGQLKDLGTLVYLIELTFSDYTRETSTIEDFVAAQRTARVAKGLPAGNSTGIVMKGLNYSDVTFEGVKVTSNEATLKWTTDSITLE